MDLLSRQWKGFGNVGIIPERISEMKPEDIKPDPIKPQEDEKSSPSSRPHWIWTSDGKGKLIKRHIDPDGRLGAVEDC